MGKRNARLQFQGLDGFRFPLSLIQIVDYNPVVAVFLFQIFGRIQSDNVAVGDERHPVAQEVGVHHVMGSDKNRGSLFPLLLDNPSEQHRAGGVKAAGGFVQEQQPGIAHQRPGQAHSLAHPLGVGGHRLFQKVRLKFQRIQQLPHIPPLLLGIERSEIVQIVYGAQIGVQVGKLKQDANLLKKFLAVGGGNVLPKQGNLAAVTLQNSSQNFLGCGLPGAVRPQEAENLPVLHGEVQAVEGLLVFAVGERQVFDLDHSSSPHFPRRPFFCSC